MVVDVLLRGTEEAGLLDPELALELELGGVDGATVRVKRAVLVVVCRTLSGPVTSTMVVTDVDVVNCTLGGALF
jgi:hypothetical protein